MPEILIGTEVVRFDTADTIEIDRCDFVRSPGKFSRTPEGYLKGTAPIAKVGILTYLRQDGSVKRELVPEETLFNQDSMNTLMLQPMTNMHPVEVLLDSVTVKNKKVGMTGEIVKREDNFLVTSMVITDADAVTRADRPPLP
jgi:hypothetical protein